MMKDITKKDLEENLKLVVAASGEFKVENKNFELGKDEFAVIAGAHQVESMEQMEKIAKTLKENNLKFLRGGIYKPHTFPYKKSDMVEDGLKILKEVSDKYNFVSVSEIMAVDQIEYASPYIDVLQVGARNMQNLPLLIAFARTGKPVLLKKHPGSSLRDFLGAAEWLMYYGCKNLILCERGVTIPFTHDVNARWVLDIEIVPAIKRITKLPIILDVTHSSGVREFVPPLMTAAAGVGANGLMIEIKPEEKGVPKLERDQMINLEEFSQTMVKVKKINDIMGRKTI